jgi:hypothetical protein
MMKPEKYESSQMGLFDEWECSQTEKGTDVFSTRSGLVRRELLLRCRKERALTQEYGYPLRKPPNTRDVRWVV